MALRAKLQCTRDKQRRAEELRHIRHIHKAHIDKNNEDSLVEKRNRHGQLREMEKVVSLSRSRVEDSKKEGAEEVKLSRLFRELA